MGGQEDTRRLCAGALGWGSLPRAGTYEAEPRDVFAWGRVGPGGGSVQIRRTAPTSVTLGYCQAFVAISLKYICVHMYIYIVVKSHNIKFTISTILK